MRQKHLPQVCQCWPFRVEYFACRQDGLPISRAHYTTEELGLRFRLVCTQNFYLKLVFRESKAHSVSCLIGASALSLCGKMLLHEAQQSPPSVTEVNNAYRYKPPHPAQGQIYSQLISCCKKSLNFSCIISVCFIWLSKQTAVYPVYSAERLVFM